MGQKWYIEKIKAAAPDLLDDDTADIMVVRRAGKAG